MDDILDMLSLIADANSFSRLPVYVTDSSEKVPSIKLDDGDLAFLLSKIDKMEAVIKSLHDAVHAMLSVAKSHTTAGNHAVDATNTIHSPRGPPAKDRTLVVNTSQAPDVHQLSEKSTSVNKHSTALPPLIETGISKNDNDDGFQVHESSRHRKQRVRKEKQVTAATASVFGGGSSIRRQPHDNIQLGKYQASASTSAVHSTGKYSRKPLLVGVQTLKPNDNRCLSITAARKYKSVYCVDNVHKSVDVRAMERFVSRRLGVCVLTCFSVDPRRTRWQRANGITRNCNAFRICISRADNAKFMDEAKWPADITISRWYSIYRDDDSNADEMLDNDSAVAVAVNTEQCGDDVTALGDGLETMMASDSQSVAAC